MGATWCTAIRSRRLVLDASLKVSKLLAQKAQRLADACIARALGAVLAHRADGKVRQHGDDLILAPRPGWVVPPRSPIAHADDGEGGDLGVDHAKVAAVDAALDDFRKAGEHGAAGRACV